MFPRRSPSALNNLHILAVLSKRKELIFVKDYEPLQAGQLIANIDTVEKVIQCYNLGTPRPGSRLIHP